MWFRNLQLYRLTAPLRLSPEDLGERLSSHAFRPCGSLETASQGWVPPLGRHAETLVHAAAGRIMVCARTQERLLPAGVVKEIVDEKVADIEDAQGRKVGRKEREQIRDDVMLDLLPRAFTRSRLTWAYLAPKDGWLVVDASTPRRAQDLITLLRQSLDSLPAAPPAVRRAPASVMTQWLAGESMPEDFALADECELREPTEGGGIVRCRRQDLTGEEIQAHLEAGKQAVKLALIWDQRLSCLLGDDLSIRRLRFEDAVQEEAAATETEDAAARFDADFALMSLELARFIPRLLEVFGGEARDADGEAA